jgi:hypothetical protein
LSALWSPVPTPALTKNTTLGLAPAAFSV